MKTKLALGVIIALILSLSLMGCTFIFQAGRRSDVQKIEQLSKQLDELGQTKRLLEDRLNQEIQDKQVSLRMGERGLVIDMVGDVLFDSGKAKIRHEAYAMLDKVAGVLRENAAQFNIGIEGHTDNQPIRLSGWKSNWELSTARSLSILHYLVGEKGISPERVSAIGYGEYHPIASNDTAEGRKLNRRVEIVILPQVTKVKAQAPAAESTQEPEENLK